MGASSLTIYIHGCNCGAIATYTRAVKAYCKANNIPLEILNSKYSEAIRQDHATILMIAGHGIDTYSPIVVDNDKITLLTLWKP
jgi:hypothetical protein